MDKTYYFTATENVIKIILLVDWLDSVLRSIGNISAIYLQQKKHFNFKPWTIITFFFEKVDVNAVNDWVKCKLYFLFQGYFRKGEVHFAIGNYETALLSYEVSLKQKSVCLYLSLSELRRENYINKV